jgi:hypothetical protein
VRDSSCKTALAEAERYLTAIKAALLKEWDPIGVKDVPPAQDEYDSYAPHIYTLFNQWLAAGGAFRLSLALETEYMGLTGNRQATERFAKRLMCIPHEIGEDDSTASGLPVSRE